ncbi:MAG: homocysteine S-methyltransferase family protein, partial [Clostridia bacterium]|nr:homocysteine S-methyltransferase family protein [Clostridia bacterium]
MKKINFENLTFDGGMGTMLMARGGMPAGFASEMYNFENPDLVTAIHKEYVDAGADVICTNTFGANPFKYRTKYQAIITAAIQNAKKAGAKYVALDIGPLGKIISKDGISFDTAYLQFSKIIKAAADKTDFIFIETMTSLAEMRAAILAAKENSNLPVVCSMSFEKGGRTFFGTPVESFAMVAEGLGVAAVGANCSVGPDEMYDIAKRFIKSTSLPIIIKPNAGLPKVVDGKTVYSLDADNFALSMRKIADLGINMLGGCCGTTPEYINLIRDFAKTAGEREKFEYVPAVCSSTTVVDFSEFRAIGERINPTGKKKLKQALIEQNYEYILSLAVEQSQQGADILDVNCGLGEIDETQTMLKLVDSLQEVVTLPLQIDTASAKTLEKALRHYNGRAIVNSVNGDDESLQSVLPIVKKYGAMVVGLALDGHGIPQTASSRLKIAKHIISAAKKAGICEKDIFIDALTLSEASEKGNALCTLDCVKELTDAGIKTILGVSNVSFGMPNREDINARFLNLAKANGLTCAIINPKMLGLEGSDMAENFLMANDNAVADYINYASGVQTIKKDEKAVTLKDAIITGQADCAKSIAVEMLKSVEGDFITANEIIPALDEVGKLYESGKFFLPQLISSADAAKSALQVVEKANTNPIASDKRFVLATVKGDVHDIGKNIVKAVVANYGISVIDLGHDVGESKLIEAVEQNYPCVVGLSALMTTTAQNMADEIKALRKIHPDISVLVGGAVLTPEFAEKIGGIYCK